ncbi:hypothetical protein KX729_20920 [Rhizobium sp. XQZ8]|uniref:hypothetical protein n=1 Tax=Rhizobium populisoli TaxID=2859785 RepID=UPI001CA46E87|nr:hypothetical protein [Rhizobium populisoli]MBW6423928.1 hypothetical protein [Rhizobium populisoli]
MIANRMKPVFVAAAVFAALSTVAIAGDRPENRWGDRGHGYHRVENSRWDRQGDGRRNRPAEIDRMGAIYANSVSHIRRMGDFYGGAIEAYGLRGLGRYFSRDYWPAGGARQVMLAPKAKIIDVDKEMGGNAFASQACAFEAGVCIIRGGN